MVVSQPQFIRGFHNLRPEHAGNVVTIGSFDGVHLGHQQLIKKVLAKSKELGVPSMAMIFEPQPHEYFARIENNDDRVPARLMRLGEKVQALFDQGIHRVLCLTFNHAFRSLSTSQFVDDVLVNAIGTRFLVIGDDFRFGSDRTGDFAALVAAGKINDFVVTDTQSLLIDEERVSSTRIRQLLENNCFDEAAKLLGKPYTVSGRVVKGNQIGRKLNAPTANVHLHRYRSPLAGVYAVETTLPTGEKVEGVANVGVRPTISGDGLQTFSKPILEVHLFDRDDNLYGQHIIVEFKHKMRDEKRFDSLDELTAQIKIDIALAREFFKRST